MSEVDKFLAHFGVKGMKWGVRKQSSATPSKSGRKKLSPRQKELLTTAAIFAGSAAVSAGAIFVTDRLQLARGMAVAAEYRSRPYSPEVLQMIQEARDRVIALQS